MQTIKQHKREQAVRIQTLAAYMRDVQRADLLAGMINILRVYNSVNSENVLVLEEFVQDETVYTLDLIQNFYVNGQLELSSVDRLVRISRYVAVIKSRNVYVYAGQVKIHEFRLRERVLASIASCTETGEELVVVLKDGSCLKLCVANGFQRELESLKIHNVLFASDADFYCVKQGMLVQVNGQSGVEHVVPEFKAIESILLNKELKISTLLLATSVRHLQQEMEFNDTYKKRVVGRLIAGITDLQKGDGLDFEHSICDAELYYNECLLNYLFVQEFQAGLLSVYNQIPDGAKDVLWRLTGLNLHVLG